MTSVQPPRWAESLLSLFLPACARDSVLGDLLEDYSETQLPARGPRGADAWYARQAFGFVRRWCLPWGLLVSAVMVARDIYDLTLPTQDFHTRAAVTTYASISVFAMGGFVAAWRSRRALSGTALGAAAALITCVVSTVYALTVGAVLLNAVYAAHSQMYAVLNETRDVPIVPIMVLGILAGSVGGAIGKAFSRGSLPQPPRRVDLA